MTTEQVILIILWESAAITTGNTTIFGIHIHNHNWGSEPKMERNQIDGNGCFVKGSNSHIWQQKSPVTIVNITHKGEQQGREKI